MVMGQKRQGRLVPERWSCPHAANKSWLSDSYSSLSYDNETCLLQETVTIWKDEVARVGSWFLPCQLATRPFHIRTGVNSPLAYAKLSFPQEGRKGRRN